MQAPGLAYSIHETGGGDNGAMVDLFSTLERFHAVTQPSILCLHLNITAYCTKSQDNNKIVICIISYHLAFPQIGAGIANKATPPTGKLHAMQNHSARGTAKKQDGERRWAGAKDLDNCARFPYNGVAYRHTHKVATDGRANACLPAAIPPRAAAYMPPTQSRRARAPFSG